MSDDHDREENGRNGEEAPPAPAATEGETQNAAAPEDVAASDKQEMKLYVGNLSYDSDERSLRDLFSPFGDITDVFLPMDRNSGRPRGFAFVTFADAENAKAAIEKTDGVELDGRTLKVNESRPKGSSAAPIPTGPECKLYVGGLGDYDDADGLREHFSKFGDVIDSFVPKSRETGRGRGFAFVTMKTADAEQAMKELHDSDFNGATLIVNVSRPKRQDRDFGGRGGGHGGRGGGYGGRGGYDDRRGGYDDRRGGYDDRRGGYDDRRGGHDDRRGGYDDRRGGYDDRY